MSRIKIQYPLLSSSPNTRFKFFPKKRLLIWQPLFLPALKTLHLNENKHCISTTKIYQCSNVHVCITCVGYSFSTFTLSKNVCSIVHIFCDLDYLEKGKVNYFPWKKKVFPFYYWKWYNKVPFLPETPMKQEPNKGHVLNGHHLALKMAIAPCCFLYYITIVSQVISCFLR